MDLSETRVAGRPAEDRIDELSHVILVAILLATLWHFL
jgi:hypothetical protein